MNLFSPCGVPFCYSSCSVFNDPYDTAALKHYTSNAGLFLTWWSLNAKGRCLNWSFQVSFSELNCPVLFAIYSANILVEFVLWMNSVCISVATWRSPIYGNKTLASCFKGILHDRSLCLLRRCKHHCWHMLPYCWQTLMTFLLLHKYQLLIEYVHCGVFLEKHITFNNCWQISKP